MLCNIFPVLSLQLMKRSTFKQFLILKKNIIYGMTVNGAWSFEQNHISTVGSMWNLEQLANWFLKNYDFIHVNSTVAGKYNKHKQDGSHLRFPIRMILATVDLQVTSILSMNFAILDFQSNNLSYFRTTNHPNASYQVSIQMAFQFRRSEK